MKFSIQADIPDALGKVFLQHLRDFDVGHDGCHFQMMISAPELSEREVNDMFDVVPPFPFMQAMRKQ